MSTLSVRFDAPLGGAGGRPAGADITDLAYRSDAGVFIAPIPQSLALPIDTLVTMTVSVEDAAGNMASTDASFFVA
ncbi:MAG: hypothetical protein GWN07_37550, partial [Actinobacteria bacterium]|nr:hypothetical protein [Actinomycetota bacterium]NIU71097.1 hypothetical protein [Actinomycetota bacterium]NIV89729.1 hypothetical protein [Actinomycetota bacterium]NIW33052.1 hypothetical protein [Actinomycetota bacterium]NIX25202.1 hypothetical protein [Actinomycetota bacterium]